MPYFVRLTTFTSEGAKNLRKFSDGRKEFMAAAEKLNVKVISEYIITGKYDILTILEAPDVETVFKLSAMMGTTGRTRNETYNVITADEFEKISQSI
jgi:uncharacterized protein with GYD domain